MYLLLLKQTTKFKNDKNGGKKWIFLNQKSTQISGAYQTKSVTVFFRLKIYFLPERQKKMREKNGPYCY